MGHSRWSVRLSLVMLVVVILTSAKCLKLYRKGNVSYIQLCDIEKELNITKARSPEAAQQDFLRPENFRVDQPDDKEFVRKQITKCPRMLSQGEEDENLAGCKNETECPENMKCCPVIKLQTKEIVTKICTSITRIERKDFLEAETLEDRDIKSDNISKATDKKDSDPHVIKKTIKRRKIVHLKSTHPRMDTNKLQEDFSSESEEITGAFRDALGDSENIADLESKDEETDEDDEEEDKDAENEDYEPADIQLPSDSTFFKNDSLQNITPTTDLLCDGNLSDGQLLYILRNILDFVVSLNMSTLNKTDLFQLKKASWNLKTLADAVAAGKAKLVGSAPPLRLVGLNIRANKLLNVAARYLEKPVFWKNIYAEFVNKDAEALRGLADHMAILMALSSTSKRDILACTNKVKKTVINTPEEAIKGLEEILKELSYLKNEGQVKKRKKQFLTDAVSILESLLLSISQQMDSGSLSNEMLQRVKSASMILLSPRLFPLAGFDCDKVTHYKSRVLALHEFTKHISAKRGGPKDTEKLIIFNDDLTNANFVAILRVLLNILQTINLSNINNDLYNDRRGFIDLLTSLQNLLTKVSSNESLEVKDEELRTTLPHEELKRLLLMAVNGVRPRTIERIKDLHEKDKPQVLSAFTNNILILQDILYLVTDKDKMSAKDFRVFLMNIGKSLSIVLMESLNNKTKSNALVEKSMISIDRVLHLIDEHQLNLTKDANGVQLKGMEDEQRRLKLAMWTLLSNKQLQQNISSALFGNQTSEIFFKQVAVVNEILDRDDLTVKQEFKRLENQSDVMNTEFIQLLQEIFKVFLSLHYRDIKKTRNGKTELVVKSAMALDQLISQFRSMKSMIRIKEDEVLISGDVNIVVQLLNLTLENITPDIIDLVSQRYHDCNCNMVESFQESIAFIEDIQGKILKLKQHSQQSDNLLITLKNLEMILQSLQATDSLKSNADVFREVTRILSLVNDAKEPIVSGKVETTNDTINDEGNKDFSDILENLLVQLLTGNQYLSSLKEIWKDDVSKIVDFSQQVGELHDFMIVLSSRRLNVSREEGQQHIQGLLRSYRNVTPSENEEERSRLAFRTSRSSLLRPKRLFCPLGDMKNFEMYSKIKRVCRMDYECPSKLKCCQLSGSPYLWCMDPVPTKPSKYSKPFEEAREWLCPSKSTEQMTDVTHLSVHEKNCARDKDCEDKREKCCIFAKVLNGFVPLAYCMRNPEDGAPEFTFSTSGIKEAEKVKKEDDDVGEGFRSAKQDWNLQDIESEEEFFEILKDRPELQLNSTSIQALKDHQKAAIKIKGAKNKDCPKPSTVSRALLNSPRCFRNADCKQNQKCCSFLKKVPGVLLTCVNPVLKTAIEKRGSKTSKGSRQVVNGFKEKEKTPVTELSKDEDSVPDKAKEEKKTTGRKSTILKKELSFTEQ